MTTLITLDDVRQLGYDDGYQAASESGTVEAPADGWDGWTINAIGSTAMCELLGEDPDESPMPFGWTEAMRAKLRAYAEGAQAGAATAVAERHHAR